MGQTIEQFTDSLREQLKELERQARIFSDVIKQADNIEGDKGECIAQSIIAMRHIEDARMRYGKVIQYLGDGESIYDKK